MCINHNLIDSPADRFKKKRSSWKHAQIDIGHRNNQDFREEIWAMLPLMPSTYRHCGLVQRCLLWRRRCPTWPWMSRSTTPPQPPGCTACTWSWSDERWLPETSPRRWWNPEEEGLGSFDHWNSRNVLNEHSRADLQSRSHSLHTLPFPGAAFWNNAHFHQQCNGYCLPGEQ